MDNLRIRREEPGDYSAAEGFDRQFESREKAYRASQEEFFIYSHSTVNI